MIAKLKTSLAVVLFLIAVCMSPCEASETVPLDSGLATIKESWKREIQKYRDPPSRLFFVSRVSVLKGLLNTAPTNVVTAGFKRVCVVDLPTLEEDSYDLDKSFETVLLQALVAKSVDQKDGSTLETILSYNCPRTLEQLVPVEFYLADKWPESVYAIFGAYRKAHSKQTRNDLISCLGWAFPSLRERYHDDGIFVAEAQKWYATNQAKLKLNDQYPFLPARPPSKGLSDKSLFLLKE